MPLPPRNSIFFFPTWNWEECACACKLSVSWKKNLASWKVLACTIGGCNDFFSSTWNLYLYVLSVTFLFMWLHQAPICFCPSCTFLVASCINRLIFRINLSWKLALVPVWCHPADIASCYVPLQHLCVCVRFGCEMCGGILLLCSLMDSLPTAQQKDNGQEQSEHTQSVDLVRCLTFAVVNNSSTPTRPVFSSQVVRISPLVSWNICMAMYRVM